MSPAVLGLALLLAAPEAGAEEQSYRAALELFRAAAPEPEPPPGLRAAEGTERRKTATAEYAAAVSRWREEEAARRRRLIERCSEHLERYPRGEFTREVRYLRGVTRFQESRFAEAREDLEAFLDERDGSREALAARQALVACCRAIGDFAAALRYAGPRPDPDLLEEAGLLDRAIEAARAAGRTAEAEAWARIGSRLPGAPEVPPGTRAVVLEAGRQLPAERKKALLERFSGRKVEFRCVSSADRAIYLLDESGVIRAVNPRPDTWGHRLNRLLGGS